MEEKVSIKYEARLNRNITRYPYGVKTVYKRGIVIYACSEKKFESLSKKNIHENTALSICEGYNVYEYFDLDKDIVFVKVVRKSVTRETVVQLKQK